MLRYTSKTEIALFRSKRKTITKKLNFRISGQNMPINFKISSQLLWHGWMEMALFGKKALHNIEKHS